MGLRMVHDSGPGANVNRIVGRALPSPDVYVQLPAESQVIRREFKQLLPPEVQGLTRTASPGAKFITVTDARQLEPGSIHATGFTQVCGTHAGVAVAVGLAVAVCVLVIVGVPVRV